MFSMELDVHTHTVASGHYTQDTITDMIKYAKAKKLTLLGISEHGPALPGSCRESYFRSICSAPALRMGLHVLYGAEVNILDYMGKLDLSDVILRKLDYCIAGMHLPCLTPGTREENTSAYIAAMHNPYVKIIAHPDDEKYPVDYHRLIEAAMDCHVLPEINNSSLSPQSYRGNATENDRTILELCARYRYPVLLSSDSHGHSDIGNFKYALKLMQETHFPEELIINASAKKFMEWI